MTTDDISPNSRTEKLRELYSRWGRYASWTFAECLDLAAGLDPENWVNANGPLVRIEHSRRGEVEAIFSRAVDLNVVSGSNRMKKENFYDWAIENVPELIEPQFREFFKHLRTPKSLTESDATLITNKRERQRRLRQHGKRWGEGEVTLTREEARVEFFEQNPDISPVAPDTFEKDLREVGIRFARGRRPRS